MIAVSVRSSASAKKRPATGAIDGPEFSREIGAAAPACASITPPCEVTTSVRPANPACAIRCDSVSRYAVIIGLSEASMQADEARRYSRSVGFNWCDSVKGTPGRCSRSSSPTRSSCAGSAIDQSRHTATASTSRRRIAAIATSTSSSSSGANSPPSASIRPPISQVSERGMYGSGDATVKLKASARPPSRSVSTSGWPAVVRNAVRAVLLVSTAFRACVVP